MCWQSNDLSKCSAMCHELRTFSVQEDQKHIHSLNVRHIGLFLKMHWLL